MSEEAVSIPENSPQGTSESSNPQPGTPEIGQSDGFKAAVDAFRNKAGLSHVTPLKPSAEATEFLAGLQEAKAEEDVAAVEAIKEAEVDPKSNFKKAKKPGLPQDLAQKRLASIEMAKAQRAVMVERDQLRTQLNEYEKMKAIKDSAKDDPYAWIKYAGFADLDEFSIAIMEKGALTPAERKVFELERRMQAKDAEAQNYQEQLKREQADTQMKDAKASVATRLRNDRERYELATHGQGPELVYAVMTELANAKPKITDTDLDDIYHQAAGYVENIMEKDLDTILSYDKVKKKLNPSTKASSASAPRQSPPRSISSKMSAKTTAAAPIPDTSHEDRIHWVAEQLKQRFSR